MRPPAILILLFVNIALRVWFFWFENSGLTLERLTNPDEQNYLTYGRELLAQGPSWFFTERSLSAPPGEAIYLAVTGGSIAVGKAVSILLSSLTLLPVVAMARRLCADGVRVPLIAAVLFTLAIPLLRTAPTLMTEPANTFFITVALAVASSAGDPDLTEKRRSRRWFLAGLLLGTGTLFRMSTLMLPAAVLVFAAVAQMWPAIRRRFQLEPARLLRGLALFTAGTFLVVAPFIVKNGVRFHQWNLGMGSGALLYLGVDPKTDGHEPFFSKYNFDTREITGQYTHVQPQGDRLLAQAARRQLSRDPLPVIGRRVKWPLRLFIGEPEDAFNPAGSFGQSWRTDGLLTMFAVWGLLWRAGVVALGVACLFRHWNTDTGFVLAGSLLYTFLALLPVFVIPRYSIPILPVLVAAAAAWFGDRKLAQPSTIALLSSATAVAVAVATWRDVFPRRTDPDDYAAHTVLATWPGASPTQLWRGVAPSSNVVVGPEGQSVLCSPEDTTLEADAPLLTLENNQIVLLPLRTRSSARQVLVQLFWDNENERVFDEAHSLMAAAYVGEWADESFHIPAHPGATLTRLRLDTGNIAGLSVVLRPGRVASPHLAALGLGDLSVRTATWVCQHDCEPGIDGAFHTKGPDPYFAAAVPPITMDYDLDVTVGINVTSSVAEKDQPRSSEIFGKLQWRRAEDSTWTPENQSEFLLSATDDWKWVRLNPSLYEGIKRWTGALQAVRLVLRCTSFRVVDIGTMKLVKDFRMMRAARTPR